MPTLIRLLIALVFLAILAFAGLYALIVFVDPGQKQITVKIPARELVTTPIVPAQPVAPVVEAAPAPTTDDSHAKEVNTPE